MVAAFYFPFGYHRGAWFFNLLLRHGWFTCLLEAKIHYFGFGPCRSGRPRLRLVESRERILQYLSVKLTIRLLSDLISKISLLHSRPLSSC